MNNVADYAVYRNPSQHPTACNPSKKATMNTMQLLQKAESIATLYEWHRRLGLHEQTLYSAKKKGRLTPAIAGAIAEQIGEDVGRWIIVAAIETERPTACRDRMAKLYQVH